MSSTQESLSSSLFEEAIAILRVSGPSPDALHKLRSSAEFGNQLAQFTLGTILFKEKDYTSATSWLARAAKSDDPLISSRCCYKLGQMCFTGMGMEESKLKAIRLFTKAASLGHSQSCFALAIIYEEGDGVEKDPSKSIEFYSKAAALGNAKAARCLGVMYCYGDGAIEKDEAIALDYFTQGADLGDAPCAFNLGVIYQRRAQLGVGDVHENFFRAVEYFTRASDMGDARAMYELGYLHQMGLDRESTLDVELVGLPQDDVKAFDLYSRAANLNHVKAMYAVGKMYWLGQGVERSLSMASDRFKAVILSGDEELTGPARDKLARITAELSSGNSRPPARMTKNSYKATKSSDSSLGSRRVKRTQRKNTPVEPSPPGAITTSGETRVESPSKSLSDPSPRSRHTPVVVVGVGGGGGGGTAGWRTGTLTEGVPRVSGASSRKDASLIRSHGGSIERRKSSVSDIEDVYDPSPYSSHHSTHHIDGTSMSHHTPKLPRNALALEGDLVSAQLERVGEVGAEEIVNCLEAIPEALVIPFGHISLQQVLGRGSSAIVHKAEWDCVDVAVKIFHSDGSGMSEGTMNTFVEEVRVMSSLYHPNIVRLMAVTIDDRPSIVMEFIRGPSLYKRLHKTKGADPLSLEQVREISIGIAAGLAYLHSNNFIHRDLKSQNILLSSNLKQVKVADFGLTKFRETAVHTTMVGTYRWMAPEVMTNEHYDDKADIYSLGMMMYEMLANKVPYAGMVAFDPALVNEVGLKGRRPSIPDDPSRWPEDLRRLTTWCWAHDPDERPSAEEVLCDLRGGSSTQLGKNRLENLITSEREYLNRLTNMVKYLIIPLSSEEVLSSLGVSADAIKTIFAPSATASILRVSSKLVVAFQSASTSDMGPVAQAFLSFSSHFQRYYHSYVSNYGQSVLQLRRLLGTNPKFKAFIEEAFDWGRANIFDYMIKPLQRIRKYAQLLTDILPDTPMDQRDALREARAMMSGIAEEMNLLLA